MISFVLSLTLALAAPHSAAASAQTGLAVPVVATSHAAAASQARTASRFPSRGVIVPGISFAGIKLGQTQQQVAALWGKNYKACSYCKDVTWLYVYPVGEPLGAAVRFQKNKVVAVFSLGSPAGWKTDKGLFMGDPIENVYNYYPSTGTSRCIGFDALTIKTGKSVTAFYSAAGVIYGFAIVTPGMTVCQ